MKKYHQYLFDNSIKLHYMLSLFIIIQKNNLKSKRYISKIIIKLVKKLIIDFKE